MFYEEMPLSSLSLSEDDMSELRHVGILRKSGRYPWGTGENPQQRNRDFLGYVEHLKKQGLSEVDIARGMGMFLEDGETVSTTQLRAAKAIAKNSIKADQISQAQRLRESGHSNIAIGEMMNLNESSVRVLLAPATKIKNDQLLTTSNLLKDYVNDEAYLDIGRGTENHLGIAGPALSTAVAVLQEEGYSVAYVKVPQLGTGEITTMKVLVPPNTPYTDIVNNTDRIKTVASYSEDNGRSFVDIEPPSSIDKKRVMVRTSEDGGADMDGVIELRRGVDDISLGEARYAQVRIKVGEDHYLKGMAMYADDLPDGVDMRFNTNKSKDVPVYGSKDNTILKPLKDDDENPFGSTVRQKHFVDAKGKLQLSKLNIVGTEDPDGNKTPGEEGGWSTWSKTLSSQFLSKQSPELAKQQLGLGFDIKKSEFDEIMSLTNPNIKRKMLDSFADDADSSAVHLKAAGLPRTANHVILPINSLKDNEIFAPNYNNGEKVVLIRHPHGGTFEIPELTVNNRNKDANRLIKNAKDAVGINSRVAAQLSGADFDGDTVLVIPNNSRSVKTSSPLASLKGFDPQSSYPAYEGMRKMSDKTKQLEMGKISNLITDMSIQGATHAQLARAVKHSMVVIDAEKHNLNYKQSAKDNNISELKAKYQSRPDGSIGGAATIISRSSSELRVNERKASRVKEGGPINLSTGEKQWTETGNGYFKSTTNKKTGVTTEKWVPKTQKSTKMAETKDAFSLVSKSGGTPIESMYANHANKLKALANTARKEQVSIKNNPWNPQAKKVYAPQVDSLKAKLNTALKNAPLERQAQLIANANVTAKRQDKPGMSNDEIKKIKGQALTVARARTGAKKQRVDITTLEWEAIQAGAISSNMLDKIIANTDLDKIKAMATPRTKTGIPSAQLNRAKMMLNNGYTQAEVAGQLGVPTSTLNDALG